MHRVQVKVYMRPEHKEAAREKARTLGLTLSEYLGRLGANMPLPEPGNHAAIRDLLKVNADLARLGNLLKLALDDDAWRAPGTDLDVEALLLELAARQAELKAAVRALK
jgi:hypothetical protein